MFRRWRRFRRGDGDALVVQLQPEELELLQSLPDQLRTVIAGPDGDPARERLFPRAYLDPTAEAEEQQWREYVYPDLVEQRFEAVGALDESLARAEVAGRDGEWREITLAPDEVQAWLGVLNDTRLILGSRLGVTEDERVVDPDDPQAGAFAVYDWLTWVQGDLIEALLGDLGEDGIE
jgi:hypothetical protein